MEDSDVPVLQFRWTFVIVNVPFDDVFFVWVFLILGLLDEMHVCVPIFEKS